MTAFSMSSHGLDSNVSLVTILKWNEEHTLVYFFQGQGTYAVLSIGFLHPKGQGHRCSLLVAVIVGEEKCYIKLF